MRTMDNLLAENGLLALAKTGAAPARVESLIDMDMDEIPELSPGAAGYESRRALRAQYKMKNAQNDKQRVRFCCEDATKIYTMLYKCAEVANKTLAAGMLCRCNMATQEEREPIPGHSFEGHWDGRMAYRLLYNKLFACARSEADKALYLAALEVQEKHHLPDHCPVSMFEEKAYTFQHNIAPHLARPFAPEDAAHYIIKMMPKCLKESGRALRERLIERDQLTDLQIVVSHCVVIVAEDQLTAASATLFNALSFPCLANETLDSLRALTGVAFEYATSGAASGAYGYSGTGGRPAGGAGSRQWCPTCSHAGTHHIGGADRPCFLDPRQPVNVPASVWANQTRVDAMTKGREANARDLGIMAGKLIPPSADAIKRYEEYAKDGKGGGKGGGRRGGGRGGGGRPRRRRGRARRRDHPRVAGQPC